MTPAAPRKTTVPLFGVASRTWRHAVFHFVFILLGLSIYTHHQLRLIERAAIGVSTNALPSVEDLADTRTALRGLADAMEGYVTPSTGRYSANATAALQHARDDFTSAMLTYAALPSYPEEVPVLAELEAAVAHMDSAMARVQHLMSAGEVALAQTTWTQDGKPAGGHVDELIVSLLKLNAGHGRRAFASPR